MVEESVEINTIHLLPFFINLLQLPGDVVEIKSPLIEIHGDSCLSFWYYSFGLDLDLLEVWCRHNGQDKRLWKIQGTSLHHEWQKQQLMITPKNNKPATNVEV